MSKGEGSSKKRKNNSNSDRNALCRRYIGCTDRLYNSSCSLIEAKRFVSQWSAQDEDSASKCSVESLLQSIPRCVISDTPNTHSSSSASSTFESVASAQHTPPPSAVSLHLPSLVSPALFRTQSGAVRSLYSYSDTSVLDPSIENGPVWGWNGANRRPGQNGPELFFKMAVCTGSTASRVWCDEDCYSVNLFRSLLAGSDTSGRSSSSSEGSAKNLYLDRQYVPCHKHRTGEAVMRYANVSVVDVCGNLSPESLNGPDFIRSNEGSKQKTMEGGEGTKNRPAEAVAGTDGWTVSGTQGTQAALLIVPSEGWTDTETGALSLHLKLNATTLSCLLCCDCVNIVLFYFLTLTLHCSYVSVAILVARYIGVISQIIVDVSPESCLFLTRHYCLFQHSAAPHDCLIIPPTPDS